MDAFEAHRPHLHAVATRMLGSRAEADDALQEAWLRIDRADTSDVDNIGGCLSARVSRVWRPSSMGGSRPSTRSPAPPASVEWTSRRSWRNRPERAQTGEPARVLTGATRGQADEPSCDSEPRSAAMSVTAEATAIRPFQIEVPEGRLAELRRR